jgi:hypothetical protein
VHWGFKLRHVPFWQWLFKILSKLLGFHGLGNWLFLIVGKSTKIFASKIIEYNVQYLSMKEGCLFVLFCLYHEIHRTGMLQIVFLVSLESS